MKDLKDNFNYYSSLLNDLGLEADYFEIFSVLGEREISLEVTDSKIKIYERVLGKEFKDLKAIFDLECSLSTIYLKRFRLDNNLYSHVSSDYLFHHLAAVFRFEVDNMALKYEGYQIYQSNFSSSGRGIAYKDYYLEPPLFFGDDVVDFCELWVRKYILKERTE